MIARVEPVAHLQKRTQVLRVVPRWHKFLDRSPTLHTIAAAEVTQVEEAWGWLGYYARARNLHRTARLVTRDDSDAAATLPADADALRALRALPGIGRYTAGAVASFAYGRRVPLVDLSVARAIHSGRCPVRRGCGTYAISRDA